MGALDAGGTKLRLVFHLSRGGDGALTATIDSLDQGAMGLRVNRAVYKEGKLTLPLIYQIEKRDATERALVQAVLDDRDFKTVSRAEIVAMLRDGHSLERTRAVARAYARRAREALRVFDPCPARDALQSLPEFVVSREY